MIEHNYREKAKSSKNKNTPKTKFSEPNARGRCANLQSFGPGVAAEQLSQKFSAERNVWAWRDITASQVLSPHRGKEVACPAQLPGMGPVFPILLRTVPKPEKARCPCGGLGGSRETGSERVPDPAGAVRVVHGQWVGLRVEHPVFQGQHVIFREQKIEIPVSPGREGGKAQPVSALWNKGAQGRNLRGLSDRPVAMGAG